MTMNQSGMQTAPEAGRAMLENIKLTKPNGGDERDLAKIRLQYAKDADPVGSLPEPQQSGMTAVLMDKLGERLAFERAGTRLYDALMVKCAADGAAGIPAKDLKHIRDEEATHFALIGAAIQSLGGDPTAQTPSSLGRKKPAGWSPGRRSSTVRGSSTRIEYPRTVWPRRAGWAGRR